MAIINTQAEVRETFKKFSHFYLCVESDEKRNNN